MRTFIAVDFPPNIIEKIDGIISYFKTQLPERALKWVAAEQLHLTIKFIGELPDHKLSEIKSILTEAMGNHPVFKMGIKGLGMYPHVQKPRVVWLGITGKQPLIELHKILDQALAKVGIKSERDNFSPHLTIARVRRQTNQETVEEIGKTLSQFKVDSLGTIEVQQIRLYQSKLTPQGPIYTSLLKIQLNKV
ncbi:MAG: RNA 2',3'-cyclic phosphodiesterase [Chloroflexota bacterium]|nr:RNA 2',3'-cyclic phosphodiesterase [Chloroflexota bacterium]